MQYPASSLEMNFGTDRRDDVFSIEFVSMWEAREARQAAEVAAGGQERPSGARRVVARGLAAISRGSATATRRLDDSVADDLGRIFGAQN